MTNDFKQDTPYPTYNPNKTNEIPGIPDWTRMFGDIEVSFKKGTRYYRNNTNIECGDYIIYVKNGIKSTSVNYTDKKAWNLLVKKIETRNDAKLFLKNLYKILQLNRDDWVYDYTINLNYNDEIKMLLYYFWHRSIIEDRIYPRIDRYYGRIQVLGPTYGVLANVFNPAPNSKKIEDSKIVDTIFKSTKSRCPECYDWYMDFKKLIKSLKNNNW